MMTRTFYDGMGRITRTLDNIEGNQGFHEAKCTARSTIAEYLRAEDKTEFEYGVFCGASEWLAKAVGIKTREVV